MTDDTAKRGPADRARVSGDEAYEVGYFARKHGITFEQAEELIRRVGNDRTELDAAAVKLR